MKRLICLLIFSLSYPVFAGNDEPELTGKDQNTSEKLKVVTELPATPVRDQHKTSTCWSFSGISLLESELLRMGKEEFDLSEMFIVHYNYGRKAERYIRMHGEINFAPGGEANDVTDVVSNFGIVPESVYSGLIVDPENHVHSEMDALLEDYVESIIENPGSELSMVWQDGFAKVLDTYLGKIPENFEYAGRSYTAKSFAEYLGIEPENYVMITSFTHQPFYKPFILEVPDNWSWGYSFNVPLDELEEIADSALYKGYSLAWATDITEDGFNFEEGIAIAPTIAYVHKNEKNAGRWDNKTASEKRKLIFENGNSIEELNVTQEIRQVAFNNYSTTDDHGMHILGLGNDRDGEPYYYVKNSWGSGNPYNGYMYVSKAYFRFKTISIMLHKDAIPSEIARKLNL
jgi:bleomycin hydrolase